MASESKYIKTKSNYVLKGKHQTINGGTVFERDFTTLSDYNGMSTTEGQVYGDSNFKFVIRNGLNQQKKHTNGRWVKEAEVVDCETQERISKDSKVIFNPDYQSLTDFAYYGSAIDLVKSTVIDAILHFPAELYFTTEEVSVHGQTYYKVSNDYGIDLITTDVKEDEVDNILRYLVVSHKSYTVWSRGQMVQECLGAVVPNTVDTTCDKVTYGDFIANPYIRIGDSGGITVHVYAIEDETILLYDTNETLNGQPLEGLSIRPGDSIIEDFYDNLSDFGKVLLNRDSKPRYTAVFNTPKETDNGYITYREKYTWPSQYGWNPDINSMAYENYVGSLIRLAAFHDEYDSDNIWRSMTHEAIKNLDWTFTRVQGDSVEEMESIDNVKVEPVLKVYGRAYDDIKRTIDTIGRSMNVTYDKKNNLPDYFIDDALELSGWETRAVNPTTDNTVKTAPLYSGVTAGYSSVDANNEFLRRLKINSPYIFSMKGTVNGIDSLLGLFGFNKEDGDYTIKEYIVVAQGNIDYDEVVEHNATKFNFMASEEDPLYGLPLRGFETNEGSRYVVPWYEKGKKYDDNTYFQMKGGWGKMQEKLVNLPDLIGEDTKYIHSTEEYTLYDETISSLKFTNTLYDLILLGRAVVKTGDVCYVTNISDITSMYNSKQAEPADLEDASHYFILINDQFADKLGYVDEVGDDTIGEDDRYGWINVTNTEIAEGGTENALKILHLESIVDDTTGNNPHMGNGKYDSGESYVENMLTPFGPTYRNENFVQYDDTKVEEVMSSCSFTSGGYTEDSKKCWYFTDDACYGETPDGDNKHLGTTTPDDYQLEWSNAATMDRTVLDITPSSIEPGGSSTGEAAANSIINVKKFVIDFYPGGVNDNGYNDVHEFIINKVLFYVKQMIPSTALFEYTIGGTSGSVANNVNG